MATHILYIVLEGDGLTPENRSHWSFAFHRPDSHIANVLQVLLLDDLRLLYHFDRRDGVPFPVPGAQGAVRLAELSASEYSRAQHLISKEPPPRDGKERCQDWVLNCVVGLEVEGILEGGSAELVGGLVGLSAQAVKAEIVAKKACF
ncbi:hypothetical protein K505DRAFT_326193 [Melanomma pulvis-pyrius CBS 109.77]|uniref:Uncharacterized protein n=1 Tax=Melanomma pulvis-pyrius CBS 109.77 TaxID=1314802 RepID=A0A6A6X8S7_9PLEO|nr:hypothetical protein K505DRAFT_326193 [Melanomma pulvis-pyrius CBS 109.77]